VILILGSPEDPHILNVCEHLRARRGEFFVINSQDFPSSDSAALTIAEHELSLDYSTSRGKVNFKDVRAVWYRRLLLPSLHAGITDQEARRFALGESRAFLRGIWQILGDRPWMNPYLKDTMAESKLYQLSLARKVGLLTPRTLVTNELARVMCFFDEVDGNMIYKPLDSYATEPEFVEGRLIPSKCVYTTIVTREVLKQFGSEIQLGPCLFQEYVPKELELRITIVGREFLAAAIHSQRSEKSKVDWRKYDLEKTPYESYALPTEVQKKLRALLDEMGLIYGAVDCILRPDGEIVFLEVNPGGQWLWVEMLTNLPIGNTIAGELARIAEASNAKQHFQYACNLQ